jgi:hypothetical protein
LRQAVRNQIAEAQKIASGSGSEADIAEAKIELEVRSRKNTTNHEAVDADSNRFSRACKQR